MEDAVCTGRNRFISVYASWGKRSDGRLLIFHHTYLHGGSVGAQCDVWIFFDEKGILHLASRVIFGEVERGEIVPIVFNLRSFGKVEADAFEYLNDALPRSGEWMYAAQGGVGGRKAEVDVGRFLFFMRRGYFFDQRLKFFFSELLYTIDELSIGALFLVGDAPHSTHKLAHHTFLGNKFHSIGFQLVWCMCICRGNGCLDRFDFLLIHVLRVNPTTKLPILDFFGQALEQTLLLDFLLFVLQAYQVLPP